MSREKKFVRVDIKGLKKETEKAYLFEMLDGTEMWVPKSQCKNYCEDYKDYPSTVEITEFILNQKRYGGNVPKETEGSWKCVNCGTSTKKGYKYCLDCYKKMKSLGIRDVSEKSREKGKILCQLILNAREDPTWDSSQNANLCRGECESGELFNDNCIFYLRASKKTEWIELKCETCTNKAFTRRDIYTSGIKCGVCGNTMIEIGGRSI